MAWESLFIVFLEILICAIHYEYETVVNGNQLNKNEDMKEDVLLKKRKQIS